MKICPTDLGEDGGIDSRRVLAQNSASDVDPELPPPCRSTVLPAERAPVAVRRAAVRGLGLWRHQAAGPALRRLDMRAGAGLASTAILTQNP